MDLEVKEEGHPVMELEAEDLVKDGSVDLTGQPAARSRTGGRKACFFIIGDEFSERLSYYGIASNLITYITTVLHESLASAAKSTNNWAGVTLVMPLVGAFLADAYVGKYWMIVVVSIIYVVGLLFLTLSVSVNSLRPAPCTAETVCPKASVNKLSFFYFSLYLISVGTGGVKPCLEAFGAGQFDDGDARERLMKISFFNWWYFGLCSGAMIAFTALVYIQDNVSWGLGFGIPAIVMAVALGTFLAGTSFYRHKRPGRSPITCMAQVFVAAARNWKLPLPEDEGLLYETHEKEATQIEILPHTNQLRCLDRAAIVDESEHDIRSHLSPWKLCSVTQVEEVKLIVRVIPIWMSMLSYGVPFAQTATLFTKQGTTMDRHMGPHFEIPAASLQAFTTVIILLLLPVYDRVFVPMMRRISRIDRGITMLQRMGVGLLLSAVCMAISAVVETKRLRIAREHKLINEPNATVPITVFWLLPQYIVIGVADIFALVGQQEFFYDQMPDSMRSLGMALYLCAIGVGSFLSSLIITIVEAVTGGGPNSWFASNINQGHLDYFYWLLAAISIINFCIFIVIAHFYHYKEVQAVRRIMVS